MGSSFSFRWSPAHAQSAGTVPKVGYLGFLNEPEASPFRDAFLRGLRDLGYVPGQNIIVDVRRWTTEGQLRQVLSELIRLKPDVIFVGPPFAALAAKQTTKDTPIVCGSCGDPVENGLAASLARPGGNVTGLASLSAELIGKRIGLLKELLPGVSRVAVFLFPANPGTRSTLSALDAAGRTLGLEIQRVEIRGAGDFDNAFRSAATGGAGAVVLQGRQACGSAFRTGLGPESQDRQSAQRHDSAVILAARGSRHRMSQLAGSQRQGVELRAPADPGLAMPAPGRGAPTLGSSGSSARRGLRTTRNRARTPAFVIASRYD